MVLREGRGKGLVLFWKSTINLKIKGSHRYHINTTIDKDMENEYGKRMVVDGILW